MCIYIYVYVYEYYTPNLGRCPYAPKEAPKPEAQFSALRSSGLPARSAAAGRRPLSRKQVWTVTGYLWMPLCWHSVKQTCIYIYTHTYIYTYTYVCINIYTWINKCAYISIWHADAWICIHIYIYMYMYMRVNVILINIRMYTHTSTYTFKQR